MIFLATIPDDLPPILCMAAIFISVMLTLTLIHRAQCNIGSEIISELAELHARRLARVREALASNIDHDWNAPPPAPVYPFTGWVQLTDNAITVAGQTFTAQERFQAISKDDHNICRASVAGDGRGNVLIVSHGEHFYGRYGDQGWTIEQLPPNGHELRPIS